MALGTNPRCALCGRPLHGLSLQAHYRLECIFSPIPRLEERIVELEKRVCALQQQADGDIEFEPMVESSK